MDSQQRLSEHVTRALCRVLDTCWLLGQVLESTGRYTGLQMIASRRRHSQGSQHLLSANPSTAHYHTKQLNRAMPDSLLTEQEIKETGLLQE